MLTILRKSAANPLLDPFVEAGYRGYSIRGIAHRENYEVFRASVQIRHTYDGSDDVFFECLSQELFYGADSALQWATSKGRDMVDSFLKCQSRRQRPWFQREHSR
jgi:hypothetical protein